MPASDYYMSLKNKGFVNFHIKENNVKKKEGKHLLPLQTTIDDVIYYLISERANVSVCGL